MDVIQEVLRDFEQDIADEAIERAKNHLKGQLVLSMESPGSRMQALGRSVLMELPILSVDEVLARIDAVTHDDVMAAVRRVLRPQEVVGGVHRAAAGALQGRGGRLRLGRALMIDVLVTGAAGRMGSLSATTIAAQADMRIVALVDPKGRPRAGEAPAFKAVDEALALTSPTAALEFSVPGAVFANAKALLEAGVPTVVGATGLTDEQAGELAAAAAAADAGLVIAPNFALGAVLPCASPPRRRATTSTPRSSSYTRRASWTRRPAPACARRSSWRARARRCARRAAGPASRGLQAGNVTIHSVRLPGLVAHQEVLFGGDDELLTIRHDSFSRRSFMAGVLLALRRVGDLHETVVGLEHLL